MNRLILLKIAVASFAASAACAQYVIWAQERRLDKYRESNTLLVDMLNEAAPHIPQEMLERHADAIRFQIMMNKNNITL